MGKNNYFSQCSILIIFLLSFTISPYSQPEIRKVKSPGDVISNYLSVIGGKDKIKNIHSYRIIGTANFFGLSVSYDEYADSSRYYLNIGNDTIKIIKLVINRDKRWVESVKEGEDTVSVIDLSDIHHVSWNNYMLKFNFIFFFVNYKNYGLNLHLDKTDDTTEYLITFLKDDTMWCSAVFDKKNWYLKKFRVETPGETILGFNNLSYKFEDYKEIPEKGLIMPYTIIRNELVPIEITGYNFNSPIDEKLFQKPLTGNE